MKILILLPPKDFRDESMASIKLFLDKWSVSYEVATYGLKDCVGSHGAIYKTNIDANKVGTQDYNAIFLVDGEGVETFKLYDYRPLLDLIVKFNMHGKIIGAIGNAQKILARANIIKDKKMAIPQDEETKRLVMLFRGVPSENEFEISGNLFTVRSQIQLQSGMQGILSYLGVF